MTFRPTLALAAVSAALLCAAGAPAAAQGAAASGQAAVAALGDAEIAARARAAVADFAARPEFAGLSFAVGRGDRILVEDGAGLADLEWNEPATAGSVFRIGSITKQFTAAAIMKLAGEGKLALGDPLSKYLPQFDTGGRTVTLRQMLNHTSGIPSYTTGEFWQKSARLDLTDQQVLDLVKGKPLDFEPGSKWSYSNTNYYLLGMIVARLSGQSYADYLQGAFFGPLGLTHTRYGAIGPVIPQRVQGYAYDFATRRLVNAPPISMGPPGGAGGLISTAGDLVRWQMALTGGKAIGAEAYRQMIGAPVDTGRGGMKYGFGLFASELEGRRMIEHDGAITGFNGFLSWLPDENLHIAVISNSESLPAALIERRILAALVGNKPLEPLRDGPDPRSEAAVRKLIAGQASGTPDYSTMSPLLADAVRAQLPQLQPLFKAWGEITSVELVAADLTGLDTFLVKSQNGPPVLFDIVLAPDGTIELSRFRFVDPPPSPSSSPSPSPSPSPSQP